MHIAFLNPQGNFDADDSYWTEHPDFGGQLVYVKNVAIAMARHGHRVDIVTRLVDDPDWPEFSERFDRYADGEGVRIVRIRCGDDDRFLRKELLWPYLGRDWVPNIVAFYRDEGGLPDAVTGHYGDGGVAAALLEDATGIPYTFTAHSLGAQKLDKLLAGADEPADAALAGIDEHYHFGERLVGERLSMNRSAFNITSTSQERVEQYGHPAYQGAVDVDDDRRFEVIPPGVNLAVFDRDTTGPDETAVAARVEARLERDLAPDRVGLPAVVSSSRLDPKKNITGLVRAFASSSDLRARANLVILTGALDDPLRDDGSAGESERAVLADIRSIVAEGGLTGAVSGFSVRGQQALAGAYRHLVGRRSVFALTALYEPFGLAPLEAAAAGLALVVTRNGGPSESLREGDTEYGVLVDPTDPGDIARGLLRLVSDPAEWERMAAAGRQRVYDRYTWDRTAEAYLAGIAAAVAEPDARRPAGLLPIHPFFADAGGGHAIATDELAGLYRGTGD
jgi:sucrose-phosphate synthase